MIPIHKPVSVVADKAAVKQVQPIAVGVHLHSVRIVEPGAHIIERRDAVRAACVFDPCAVVILHIDAAETVPHCSDIGQVRLF